MLERQREAGGEAEGDGGEGGSDGARSRRSHVTSLRGDSFPLVRARSRTDKAGPVRPSADTPIHPTHASQTHNYCPLSAGPPHYSAMFSRLVETNKLETARYSSTGCSLAGLHISPKICRNWKNYKGALFCFLTRDFEREFALMICSSVLLGHGDFGWSCCPHVYRNKSIDSSLTVAVCSSESELIFDRSSLAGSLCLDPAKQPSFQKHCQEQRKGLNCISPYLFNTRVATQANRYFTCHFFI